MYNPSLTNSNSTPVIDGLVPDNLDLEFFANALCGIEEKKNENNSSKPTSNLGA